MKLKFKYNVLHIKTKTGVKHRFKNISIFFDWTYFKKIELQIFKPKKIHFRKLFDFYDSKFVGELPPGCGRKKNKLTFTKQLNFFNLKFIFKSVEIISKYEYRKRLKKAGLLK